VRNVLIESTPEIEKKNIKEKLAELVFKKIKTGFYKFEE
jgi:hypothetical protein